MADQHRFGPPPTRREDVVDVVHGVDVHDPYRWLENGDDPEVVEWVAAQNRFTREALDALPERGRWHDRLSALVALPTALTCKVRGERLFVLERHAGADQFALVVRSSVDPAQPPTTLLDPAARASDAAVAIDWFEPSPDGGLVAIGLSEGGTEHSTLHLFDVGSGAELPTRIPHTRAASVAWRPDSSGFWYARYPEGDQYHRHIRHHHIGDDPAADPIVFDRLPTPQAWPDVQVSPDGGHLLVEMLVGWGQIDAHLLDVASGEWHVMSDGVEALTSLAFAGDGLVGVTTAGAPNGRLVAIDLGHPGIDHWRTIVAERPDVVLGRPAYVAGSLLVAASRAAVDTLERWSLDGEPLDTGDCEIGVSAVQQIAVDSAFVHETTVAVRSCTNAVVHLDRSGGEAVKALDPGLEAAFVVVSSFDSPTTVYRWDRSGLRSWCPTGPSANDLGALTVRHLVYPSLDGTEIGLFVIHRADVSPSPDRPLILNGYGGFAITESPAWLPNLAAWCAEGGVWAIAGLRGGGEHGEGWHHAGRRGHKQRVFDDFHAAADWLVANHMASYERLALVGGSNGGLLVGAALTQRPDLARAVWCAVPLLDMIRFPQFLIARLWTDEFGDPDVADEFAWLHAYSPYHAVEAGRRYPAVLFTTAEGDTRVDPLHARKMAALLQSAAIEQDDRPVLLLQAGRAGHGVGKPASMRIDEGVDVLSFLWSQLCAPA